MKVGTIAGLLGLVSPILGFLDTGSVYLNQHLDASKYIIESDELVGLINEKACGDKNVWIYNIPQISAGNFQGGSFINHVHYSSAEDIDRLSSVCGGENHPKVTLKAITHLDEIEIDMTKNDNDLVIVQEIPTKLQSRGDSSEDEISAEFAKAKSMAAEAEEEDGIDEDNEYHILDDNKNNKTESGSDDDKDTNDSLFNTYQFFTPGIFMCMIVSFLLLFILLNALSWINNIEITYKSFDKQVDFEKKTE